MPARESLETDLVHRRRVQLLGVKIDPVTVQELHGFIREAVVTKDHVLIPNVNVYGLNLAYDDPELRAILDQADLVFCDGAGVMLGARLTGQAIPERITYADWMWQLAEFAAKEGFSFYFVGAHPGVAERAAEALHARVPGLRIAGVHHGYFNHEPDSPETRKVINAINQAQPDILIVGLGMPLQEYWLAQNWSELDVRVGLTGGAVFDYISGNLRRGPVLLNDHGFEWLSRLLVEPDRLWKRYLIGNPIFLWRVCGQVLNPGRWR